jgi:hypothetical protein
MFGTWVEEGDCACAKADRANKNVRAVCSEYGHNTAIMHKHATAAPQTEIARHDLLTRSSTETRTVSHRAANEPKLSEWSSESRSAELRSC